MGATCAPPQCAPPQSSAEAIRQERRGTICTADETKFILDRPFRDQSLNQPAGPAGHAVCVFGGGGQLPSSSRLNRKRIIDPDPLPTIPYKPPRTLCHRHSTVCTYTQHETPCSEPFMPHPNTHSKPSTNKHPSNNNSTDSNLTTRILGNTQAESPLQHNQQQQQQGQRPVTPR